jgi:hypothetical protein
MPLVHQKNPKFLYYVPPKTASTSIIAALQGMYPEAKVLYDKHGIYEPFESVGAYGAISVRNPFSRIISLWQFFEHEQSFGDFIRSKPLEDFSNKLWHALPQVFWLGPSITVGQQVVRFEDLQDGFSSLCSKLNEMSWNANPDSNIVQIPVLKHLNKTGEWTNTRGVAVNRDRPWWEYYGPGDEDIIRNLYSDDFKSFNYNSSLEAAIPKN